MSVRSLAVLLHAWAWPDPPNRDTITRAARAAAHAASFEPTVIEVREDVAEARGAAARLNDTIARTRAGHLLVLDPSVEWREDELLYLLRATIDAPLAVLADRGHRILSHEAPGSDWIGALLDAVDRARSWTTQGEPPPTIRAWACTRELFDRLGGLDARLWHVGMVDDLAARVRATGERVEPLERTSPRSGPDSYPLPRATEQLLAVRQLAATALKTRPPEEAGPVLAHIAAAAIAASWRAAAIPASKLRFGGNWGQRRPFLSLRPAPPAGSDALAPADWTGTVMPLLALDSVLDDLPVWRSAASTRKAIDADSPDTIAEPTTEDHVDAIDPRAHAVDAAAPGASLPDGEAHGQVSKGAGIAPLTSLPAASPPLVSVIVVNWNGREHLRPCIESLLASDYPADRLEIVCVDNGSTDGSRELIASAFPSVRLVALPENRGFTGGNNAGVAQARGSVLVFLNNDMRVERDTISRLVGALDDHHPCATARVLSWDGRRIDFVAGTLTFEALGFQEHYGAPASAVAGTGDSFFPNGGAFAITRDAYERSGGFDDHYFAYYDDVDLGWRVRLLGGRVRVVADAVAHHRHGATSGRHPEGQKRYLMERNALWTVFKNYGDDSLRRVLAPALLLAARRVAQDVRVDPRSAWARSLAPFVPRLRARGGRPIAPAEIYRGPRLAPAPPGADVPLVGLAAIGTAVTGLREVMAARAAIQSARQVPDSRILPLFGRPFDGASTRTSYAAAHDAIVEAMNLGPLFRGLARVLFITHEPLATNMSGPGVRVLELARALAARQPVTIATPFPPAIVDERCRILQYDAGVQDTLVRLAEQADLLVVQGFTLSRFPALRSLGLPIVVDLYCPFTIEHLEMHTPRSGADRRRASDRAAAASLDAEARAILDVQNQQLGDGDFFLCASERQRDFWLGALHTAGRINPLTYAADRSLRSLIDVVPFGVPETDPCAEAERARATAFREGRPAGIRARFPAIAETDRVLVWAGSLLDWQDPETLVRAVGLLWREREDVKLVFMGTRHPNPAVPPMAAVDRSRAIARELGLDGSAVFFNDWVPYAERAAWLLEADLGVSTHVEHLETRLSFRTRMLDYIWAQLPIVCSDGDHFAALVRERGLGLVVPPGDPAALADAIRRLLDDRVLRHACRERLADVRDEMRWSRVAAPLARFCARPAFAADRLPAVQALRERLRRSYRLSRWVKRTALDLGVSEATFEQVKQWGPVQAGMRLRNRLVLATARAAARAAGSRS